jgi:pimeloyl-ACP methyl ester carboxylesterase
LGGCPPIRFIFPHAPSMPITLNGGYLMPAWYDIAGTDLISRQDATGIAKSERAICALIDQEIARGVAPERIVLAGFSQGCAMALHTGLRYPKRLAGIVALSGYLPLQTVLPTSATRPTPAHRSSWPTALWTPWWYRHGASLHATHWWRWATRCSGTPTPCSTACTRVRWQTYRSF